MCINALVIIKVYLLHSKKINACCGKSCPVGPRAPFLQSFLPNEPLLKRAYPASRVSFDLPREEGQDGDARI